MGGVMGQNQDIGDSSLANSEVQQTQAGRDAVSFQNSKDNQVTINNTILQLFGKSEPQKVDWEWGKRLLKEKQLPDIRQRLTDTLGQKRISIDVSFAEQLSWVNRTLQIDGQDYGNLDANKLLIETYGRDDIAGKLLILGAPGAGKTTALLSLAEQLVCGALENSKTIIPVIFELSTWRDDNQSIEQWLIEQLYELHGGNRKEKIYETWLQKQVLLPLLDGLDELGLERQKKCTIKLQEFAQNYPHVLVCCRLKEFEAVNLKLKTLRGAVCLQPLSDIQIQNYLHSLNRSELWSVIQKNAELGKLLKATREGEPGLLRVPLFVKLVVDVYDPEQAISSKADLLEKYIDRQLSIDTREQDRRKEKERGKWAYKKVENEPHWRQTRKTLSWIARQLQANNTVELLIEQMQPSWLESKSLRRNYRLIFGLIVGLIFLQSGVLISWILLFWVILFMIGILISSDDWHRIKVVEAFQISISRSKLRAILDYLRFQLSIGLIGSGSGIFIALMGRWEYKMSYELYGLNYELNFALITMFAFAFVLPKGLYLWSNDNKLEMRSRPNQGIWNSFQNILCRTFLNYPFSVIIVTIFLDLNLDQYRAMRRLASPNYWLYLIDKIFHNQPQYLLIGLYVALILCFWLQGGKTCIQHLCLRFILWQSGVPWNIAQFLDYCVERRLLLSVGGRYRFLHRELLDHFAQSSNP